MDDKNIQALINGVNEWSRKIVESVASGDFSYDPESIKIYRMDYFAPDPRTEILADNALSILPIPLKTLVIALRHLKEDIAHEMGRQRVNYDNAVYAQIEGLVNCLASGLQRLCLTEKIAVENPDDILKEIADKETLYMQKMKEASEITPLMRERNETASISNSNCAIRASMATRERLKALATGTMAQFFDPPSIDLITVPEELTHSVTSRKSDTFDDSEIVALKLKLRSVRRAIEAAVRDNEALLNIAIQSFTQVVQSFHIHMAQYQFAVPKDFANADIKIQEEIKYLLGTLSVDKTALDCVLRNIRRSCDDILSTAASEASATASIRSTQWRLRLSQELDAFRNSTLWPKKNTRGGD